MVEYKLVSSGSKGNAIVYEKSILVDFGITYKLLKDEINDVKVILISHSHSDHYREYTLKRIVKQLPNVVILCGIWFKPIIECVEMPDTVKIVYCDPSKWYKVGNMMFAGVPLFHDVHNFGWRIIVNGKKIFHATDTYKLDGITAYNQDLYAVEAHHITSVIDKTIEEKQNAGIFCYEVGAKKSHLSEEACDKWLEENKGEFSEVLKLHYSYCYEVVDGKLRVLDEYRKDSKIEQIQQ